MNRGEPDAWEPSGELQALSSALVDEMIDEDGEARLAELLKESRHARAWFVDYTGLSAALQWRYSEVAVDPGPPGRVDESKVTPIGQGRRDTWQALAAVAALVVVTLFALQAWHGRDRDEHGAAGNGSVHAMESLSVGELISSDSASWVGEAPLPGDRIEPGTLTLSSGSAVVAFDSQARLTLIGPAILSIESEKAVSLLEGRAAVYAPEEAVGFTLKTLASDFVDLGTEFGVEVVEDGSAELHVFDGVVVARPHANDAVVPLLENEAGRIDGERGEIYSIRPQRSRFPGLPAPDGGGKLSSRATPAQPAYAPLPPDARVVFLGDRVTDLGTHLLLLAQAFGDSSRGNPPGFFNAGVSFPLSFDDADFAGQVALLNPTHAVLEFGPEISTVGEGVSDTPEKFLRRITRLLDRLEEAGIEAIVATGFPLGPDWEKSQARLDGYNDILRGLARERELRMADLDRHFRNMGKEEPDWLLKNRGQLNFYGYQELTRVYLDTFGFRSVPVPRNLRGGVFPGVIPEWEVRWHPREASADEPAEPSAWEAVSLPVPPTKMERRSPNRNDLNTYRDRAAGFFIHAWRRDHFLEARTRYDGGKQGGTRYLNLGGSPKAVFVNGEAVPFTDEWKGWHAGKLRLPVEVRPGPNEVVVVSDQRFFLSVTEEPDWIIPAPPPRQR